MKTGKTNNEAPLGIITTYLDTRVDKETKKKRNTQATRLKKGSGHSTKYMHHTNKKAIKSQNRNNNTTAILPKDSMCDVIFFLDIYFTEFGTALTTILPILFQYCYKYCYSDSRDL